MLELVRREGKSPASAWEDIATKDRIGGLNLTDNPEIGGRQPIPITVEANKSYWWCACGRSKSQPFCDGSHKATSFSPIEFKAATSGQVWFCACKRSAKKPMCDGSHKAL
jgi:CDGSH iron-sulfur domain-containing protein 3